MGLDIIVYDKAMLTPPHERDDNCYERGHHTAFCYEGMEASTRGLKLNDEFDHGIHYGRCYDTSGAESFHFRAGSYSGYSAFREALCEAGLDVAVATVWEEPARYVNQPFYELLNFADNEGTIGPEAAEDLYHDFVTNRDKVLNAWSADGQDVSYFATKYEEWTHAFDMARKGGMVVFC